MKGPKSRAYWNKNDENGKKYTDAHWNEAWRVLLINIFHMHPDDVYSFKNCSFFHNFISYIKVSYKLDNLYDVAGKLAEATRSQTEDTS